MKKLLYVIGISMSSLIAFSQVKIKAGSNTSFTSGTIQTNVKYVNGTNPKYILNGNYKDFTKSKTSIYLGVGYEIKGGENYNFTPEIVYSRFGSNSNGKTSNSYQTPKSFNLDYLSFSFMFEHKVIQNIKIGIGPQINFKLGNKTYYGTSTMEVNELDYYEALSAGLNIGMNYVIWRDLSIEARYHLALTNATKRIDYQDNSALTIYEIDNKMKVNTLQIGLAYKF